MVLSRSIDPQTGSEESPVEEKRAHSEPPKDFVERAMRRSFRGMLVSQAEGSKLYHVSIPTDPCFDSVYTGRSSPIQGMEQSLLYGKVQSVNILVCVVVKFAARLIVCHRISFLMGDIFF